MDDLHPPIIIIWEVVVTNLLNDLHLFKFGLVLRILDLDLDWGLSVLVLHIKDSFVNESASINILYFNAISNFTPQRIFDNDTLPSKHVQNRKLQKRCTRRSSNCKENESTFRIKLKINIILLHLMKENNDHTSY